MYCISFLLVFNSVSCAFPKVSCRPCVTLAQKIPLYSSQHTSCAQRLNLMQSSLSHLRHKSNGAVISNGGFLESLSGGLFRHTLHVHTPHQHTCLSFCWLNLLLMPFLVSPTKKDRSPKQHKQVFFFSTESFCCAILHLQTLTHSVIRHCSQTT